MPAHKHLNYIPNMLPSGQYAVRQLPVNGWDLSYNPDDERFYVCPLGDDEPKAIRKDLRNAVGFARTNTPPPRAVCEEKDMGGNDCPAGQCSREGTCTKSV